MESQNISDEFPTFVGKFSYPHEKRDRRGITILYDDPLKADMIRMTVASAVAAAHSQHVIVSPAQRPCNIMDGERSLQELMMELDQKSFDIKKRDDEMMLLDRWDEFDIKDGLHNNPPHGVTRRHHKMIMAMNKKGKR